jgi:hypothetical protein
MTPPGLRCRRARTARAPTQETPPPYRFRGGAQGHPPQMPPPLHGAVRGANTPRQSSDGISAPVPPGGGAGRCQRRRARRRSVSEHCGSRSGRADHGLDRCLHPLRVSAASVAVMRTVNRPCRRRRRAVGPECCCSSNSALRPVPPTTPGLASTQQPDSRAGLHDRSSRGLVDPECSYPCDSAPRRSSRAPAARSSFPRIQASVADLGASDARSEDAALESAVGSRAYVCECGSRGLADPARSQVVHSERLPSFTRDVSLRAKATTSEIATVHGPALQVRRTAARGHQDGPARSTPSWSGGHR